MIYSYISTSSNATRHAIEKKRQTHTSMFITYPFSHLRSSWHHAELEAIWPRLSHHG